MCKFPWWPRHHGDRVTNKFPKHHSCCCLSIMGCLAAPEPVSDRINTAWQLIVNYLNSLFLAAPDLILRWGRGARQNSLNLYSPFFNSPSLTLLPCRVEGWNSLRLHANGGGLTLDINDDTGVYRESSVNQLAAFKIGKSDRCCYRTSKHSRYAWLITRFSNNSQTKLTCLSVTFFTKYIFRRRNYKWRLPWFYDSIHNQWISFQLECRTG